ncbi:adenosylcobyric acid synthase (glutamine-hydrolysing) [Hydrogenispora ethanolica]|uniref:Cobyric acid synthase n=1 Tax=Hydrogenispora ethanolica TaxID=1082276 RepID=A0A4R1S503_HYDET|nr:cobyric acid synthase [Hydrogenispora ethanolica]TCL74084.1 adenosylcobyric acid synthase (glutamine-hydrolysing) [Hydrogenispora ethanolica]
MPARTVMIQGTSSSVGKSLIVAGLCRVFREDGYRVAPFKSQNMALNSAVTPDGCEISRSQTMQAEAARVTPTVAMNPVLLKPKGDRRAQVILRGKPFGDFEARQYREEVTGQALETVRECLEELRRDYQIVVIEGAGSPAEINLRAHDIANMTIAAMADAPVILVGDIDRGGCLAALVGTMELLAPEERRRVKGIIINKFRGDRGLLQPGLDFLEERLGLPILGVLPYVRLELPEEDSLGLPDGPARGGAGIVAGVIRLPRIANFTDFDALRCDPGVTVRYIERPDELDGVDLIILPGTKNTTADLAWLRQSGLAERIAALAERTLILGICGGYQMLGREIHDPAGLESELPQLPGLGLLPVITRFEARDKTLRQVDAVWPDGAGTDHPIQGYEIHQGISEITGNANLFRLADGGWEGCQLEQRLFGTYLHGCLDNDFFRNHLLRLARRRKGLPDQPAGPSFREVREGSYRRLAAVLRQHLDLATIYEWMGFERGSA